MAKKQVYAIGEFYGHARTKTEARTLAESNAAYASHQIASNPFDGIFPGLGEIEQVAVLYSLHGWQYGYQDQDGWRCIGGGTEREPRSRLAERAIAHVADLYMGDLGHIDFENRLKRGTEWVVAMCRKFGLSDDASTAICADIDYKRRCREQLKDAQAAAEGKVRIKLAPMKTGDLLGLPVLQK